MLVERFSYPSRLRRAVVAWLLGFVLVLQLVAPVAGMPRPDPGTSARLAALAKIVGHAVTTCHEDDGGRMPAGDAGPCCPCTLCHVHSAACPAESIVFALMPPVAACGVAAFPQPPPRAPAVLLGLSSPRGPPLFV